MQSFPAPELKDRNHNHKIQKLLSLVQTLKEEEPAPRTRRLSLPLPTSPTLQSANHGRGSLQVFTTNDHDQSKDITRNGFQKKPVKAELEINVIVNESSSSRDRGAKQKQTTTSKSYPQMVDVISAEPPIEVLTDRRTIIDLDGLQCTRV